MSREEDSFRMHVHILPNNKWVCNFCGYEYSGDTTRIRAHLAGVAGYGIQGCENVDSQKRSKALTAWKGKRPAKSSNRQRYLEGGPHLRVTPSSGVMSTVNASSSAFLPLPKTNLPNQSLPPQNMNPRRPQSHAVGSYFLPRSLSPLIRFIRQPDLVSKDLTNMLRLVNAEVEEPNTKVPQGNEGRIDNIRSNDDQLTNFNSLLGGWSEIGKIAVSSKKIGEGSKGTIVYEGKYDGRLAAVKRLVRDCFDDVVSKEIDILIKSDRHENIVRYYGVEKDRHFVYLALELCTCSLDDLIQVRLDSSNSAYPRDPASTGDYKIKLDSVRGMMQDVNLWWADNYPSPQLMKLMRDMVLGLSHLHDLRIIHRDLKPRNVLITDNGWFGAQLSDMGISRCLVEDKSSLGCHDTGCGTTGWRAPEVLRSGGRQTLAMDLFSLGCVLFFCITRGKHPFGDNVVRDSNILDDKKDLSRVEFIPEAHDLILCLLNREPKLRPKASEVLHHPFFWSSKMRLTFLHDISDEVESEARKGNLDLVNALENIAQLVFDGNWDEKIDKDVMDDLRQHRRMPYDGSRVKDLLRVVRNKFNHLGHAPEKVKAIHGSDPNDLDAYFAKRFPRLLIESYKVVSQNCKKEKLLVGVLSK